MRLAGIELNPYLERTLQDGSISVRLTKRVSWRIIS